MPITIQPTFPGAGVGPGALLQAQSSLVGPLPPGTAWTWTVSTDADQQSIISDGSITSQLPLSHFIPNAGPLANPSFTDTILGLTYTETQADSGSTVYVRAQLSESGNLVDSTTQPMVWDNTVALPNIQEQLQQQGGVDITTPLTAVIQGVTRAWDFPFLQYFGWTPPPEFLSRSSTTFTITGEFEIAVPVGTFGFIWQWTIVPIGVGVIPTVPRLFDRTMLSISEIHRDPELNEFVSQFVQSRTENIPYNFNRPQPNRLHLRTTPAVTGVGQWLQLLP